MRTFFFVAAQSKLNGRCANRCYNVRTQDDARAAFERDLRYWNDKSYEVYQTGLASEQQIFAHYARLVDAGAMDAENACERTTHALKRRVAWLNNPRKAA